MTAAESATEFPGNVAVRPMWPGSSILPTGLLRFPGVYRPQQDTALLAEALVMTPAIGGEKVLDVCTGTGALAVLAAQRPGAEVTAIDVSRRAVASAWYNAYRRKLPIRVRRTGFAQLGETGRFDLVLANPPLRALRPDRARHGT